MIRRLVRRLHAVKRQEETVWSDFDRENTKPLDI